MSTLSDTRPVPARGAAVRFPFPPALFGAFLAAALATHHWLLPLPLPVPSLTRLGAAITIGGLIFSLSAAATVLGHRSTLAPHRAVSSLVTTGPFRLSRNPMYTGHAISMLGAALWSGSCWPLILAPVSLNLVYRLVVRPEEQYLADRFGDEYNAYCTHVRRWL